MLRRMFFPPAKSIDKKASYNQNLIFGQGLLDQIFNALSQIIRASIFLFLSSYESIFVLFPLLLSNYFQIVSFVV